MYGLKHVRRRRLEARLASYYAGQGYQVEHPGAPGSRHRFDGCIDLKLWRDGEYILVQCKGWRALQVQRDEVHQLIGLVVSEGATGGILVTFGEFSPGAIDAAARGGHVRLVDGEDLRAMLGVPPAAGTVGAAAKGSVHHDPAVPATGGTRGWRAIPAAFARHATALATGLVGLSIVIAMLALLFGFRMVKTTERAAVPAVAHVVQPALAMPVAQGPASDPASAPTDEPVPAPPPTDAEIRESQRKAEDAMKVTDAPMPEV